MKQRCGALLIGAAVVLTGLPLLAADVIKNIPEMVEADGRLRFSFGEERMVLPRGCLRDWIFIGRSFGWRDSGI